MPALWRLEVASLLVAAQRQRRVTESDVARSLSFLSALDISMDADAFGSSFATVVALAQTHQLSVYDATYLELAGRLGCDLATSDKALARAAAAAGIRVV